MEKTISFKADTKFDTNNDNPSTTVNASATNKDSTVVLSAKEIPALEKYRNDETSTKSHHASAGAGAAAAEPIGKYSDWSSQHGLLAAQPWCCIGDLIHFCNRYEYKTISVNDTRTHSSIVAEVRALLSGQAPFDMRKRFPGDIRNHENLWVCIGRCAAVEYHLNRILSVFRKPLEKLSTDKKRVARQNFHLAVNELRLDISARITEVRLYDRLVFERDFHLTWQDTKD